jgi:Holliday junction resolvasome RuvABC endonuclease subunit
MNMHRKNTRILGIAPSTKGVGFAVIEGEHDLVDWGVKSVKGDKNARSLEHVILLLQKYRPGVLAMENICSKGTRRSRRIQTLAKAILASAMVEKLEVHVVSRQALNTTFLGDERGTKHEIAEQIAKHFSKELGTQVPKKRRAWENQAYQMDFLMP